jgi:phospholipid/cholesterol/gamma-HCH transport system substrate-binding protein
MHRKSIDVWVGLFVLLGLLALVFLALKAGNMSTVSFSKTYAITGKFDNIGGLKPQAPVKSAGVVVGRVDSITFDDKSYQALATLSLESRYAFPKDSSVKILTSGLLGEQYIGIQAGADDKNLVQGDNITATQSAVVLENLIGQFLFSKAAESSGAATGNTKK